MNKFVNTGKTRRQPELTVLLGTFITILKIHITYNFILEFGVFIFLHFLKDCKSGIAIFVWRITKITLTFPRLKSDYVRNINISERARMKVWLSSDQRFLFPKSYFYFKFR